MNLVEHTVTQIIGLPVYKYNRWWRLVEFICYGTKGETQIMTNTEEQSLDIKVGYKFNA